MEIDNWNVTLKKAESVHCNVHLRRKAFARGEKWVWNLFSGQLSVDKAAVLGKRERKISLEANPLQLHTLLRLEGFEPICLQTGKVKERKRWMKLREHIRNRLIEIHSLRRRRFSSSVERVPKSLSVSVTASTENCYWLSISFRELSPRQAHATLRISPHCIGFEKSQTILKLCSRKRLFSSANIAADRMADVVWHATSVTFRFNLTFKQSCSFDCLLFILFRSSNISNCHVKRRDLLESEASRIFTHLTIIESSCSVIVRNIPWLFIIFLHELNWRFPPEAIRCYRIHAA